MGAENTLDVAVRVHTVRQTKSTSKSRYRRQDPEDWQADWPGLTLVIDCETTTDPAQRLTFGFYRVLNGDQLLEEGVFVAEDLPERDRRAIATFAAATRQDDSPLGPPLVVRSRDAFLREVFFPVIADACGLLVAFNMPFDLSRLACEVGLARGRFKGGFSFTFLTYTDERGVVRADKLVPRIAVKALDSKRALIGLTSAWKPTTPQQGSKDGRRRHSGHFVDLRTLLFALTGEAHTLASAARALGIVDGKREVEEHGRVTPDYLAYSRHDVALTAELYRRALAEYCRHPIALPPDKAYSPASIGKAYLRLMQIQLPRLHIEPELGLIPNDIHGFAMGAYYGGRAECRLRLVAAPVVYCDFRSMYPTVNTLAGLWRFLTARDLRVVDATEWTQAFLDRITADDLFRPETWRELAVLVETMPEADVVPVRAPYAGAGSSYTIGHNPLTSASSHWYTLADLVASKLVTGRTPRVRRALRLIPRGRQRGLRPVDLRGAVPIDPTQNDFFREVIRARGAVKRDTTHTEAEREAVQRFLKVLANATSYGIFVQLDRRDGETARVEIFSDRRFMTSVVGPEDPGEFYFPPLGALITGGARLMLALAEYEVVRRGGSYAFMDTDSIAIVATEQSGLMLAPASAEGLPYGTESVRVLPWADVEAISARFAELDPYGDRGHILELEGENYDLCGGPNHKRDCVCTGERRQLWCIAIAAKRYCLFNWDHDRITVRKATEHGLGAFLPPTDPDSGERVTGWIEDAWERIVCGVLNLPPLPWPEWAAQLATTRVSISTPALLDWFKRWNAQDPKKQDGTKKPYAARVKPFGFLHHVPLDPVLGSPRDATSGTRFNLVAPYGERRWWVNHHDPDGPTYRVVGYHLESAGATTLVGRAYRDLITSHPFHPEPKSVGPDGHPCHARTRGVLRRRHVVAAETRYIGKEANELERVEAGLVDELAEVQTVYERDEWKLVQEVIRGISINEAMMLTGYCRRQVLYIRSGERRARARAKDIVEKLTGQLDRFTLLVHKTNRGEVQPPFE